MKKTNLLMLMSLLTIPTLTMAQDSPFVMESVKSNESVSTKTNNLKLFLGTGKVTLKKLDFISPTTGEQIKTDVFLDDNLKGLNASVGYEALRDYWVSTTSKLNVGGYSSNYSGVFESSLSQSLNLNLDIGDNIRFIPFLEIGIGYVNYQPMASIELDGYSLEASAGANLEFADRFFVFGKYTQKKTNITGMNFLGEKVSKQEIKDSKIKLENRAVTFGIGFNF